MSTARWQTLRLQTIEAQQGRCASASSGCTNTAKDVVFNGWRYAAYCRSCRLRFDAPLRVMKAQATRAAHRGEPLPGQASFGFD